MAQFIEDQTVAVMGTSVTTYSAENDDTLRIDFLAALAQKNTDLDSLFRNTCTNIARGYAWYRKALTTTGR